MGEPVALLAFRVSPLIKWDSDHFLPGFVEVPFGNIELLEAAITPHTVAQF